MILAIFANAKFIGYRDRGLVFAFEKSLLQIGPDFILCRRCGPDAVMKDKLSLNPCPRWGHQNPKKGPLTTLIVVEPSSPIIYFNFKSTKPKKTWRNMELGYWVFKITRILSELKESLVVTGKVVARLAFIEFREIEFSTSAIEEDLETASFIYVVDGELTTIVAETNPQILLSNYGRHFYVNPKCWRLFADLLENTAYGLEILTPAFPHLFVPIGAVAGAGRSAASLIQYIAGIVSKRCSASCYKELFLCGFGAQRNFAEVIAKDETQGMVSKAIGIMLGIALANHPLFYISCSCFFGCGGMDTSGAVVLLFSGEGFEKVLVCQFVVILSEQPSPPPLRLPPPHPQPTPAEMGIVTDDFSSESSEYSYVSSDSDSDSELESEVKKKNLNDDEEEERKGDDDSSDSKKLDPLPMTPDMEDADSDSDDQFVFDDDGWKKYSQQLQESEVSNAFLYVYSSSNNTIHVYARQYGL
ncbi:Protein root UVB sensitive 1, chloroplastic [Capsicum baccatum]|uniref:Protein root UVB sensitive 1, chloroplastic n=1 Tax=Capsicum baccatum TaxID=33114 RepID=A0A2G2V3R0_CAPBA|nr:Protein root UVB sensitive 1, chloroplastic [Capsicum baccatum]